MGKMHSVIAQVDACGETVVASTETPDIAVVQSNGQKFKARSTAATGSSTAKRHRNVLGPLLCCFGNHSSARAPLATNSAATGQATLQQQQQQQQKQPQSPAAPVPFVSAVDQPPHVGAVITQVAQPPTGLSSVITQVEQQPLQGDRDATVTLEKDLSVRCIVTSSGEPEGERTTPTTNGPAHSSPVVSSNEPNHNCSQTLSKYLLPNVLRAGDVGKKCLVIDLDETLVHSSFKPVHNADFIVPVEIDGTIHQVYVLKRPHVDQFLQRVGQLYECVLFTASLAKYADPVADLLDKWGVFRSRLFREACVFHRGSYVKDLGRLGRDLSQVIIIDNSPASYIFHPDNAVPVNSWFDDMDDNELLELCPFFETLSKVDNIYTVLKNPGSGGGAQ